MRRLADPYQRRRALVDLHAEGWSNTAISASLQTPRHRVYEVFKRWALFGHKGLEDIPQWHARKAGTREIDEVGKLVQDTPSLGAYRVRAAASADWHPSLPGDLWKAPGQESQTLWHREKAAACAASKAGDAI